MIARYAKACFTFVAVFLGVFLMTPQRAWKKAIWGFHLCICDGCMEKFERNFAKAKHEHPVS